MDHVCIALPILPGKTADARAFQKELDTTRKADYTISEARLGIPREYWFIAELPAGDLLIGYFDAEDANAALGAFVQSQDEFDLWFKAEVKNATGLDLNNPPADMKFPELLSTFEA
jgi:hypothetical protein